MLASWLHRRTSRLEGPVLSLQLEWRGRCLMPHPQRKSNGNNTAHRKGREAIRRDRWEEPEHQLYRTGYPWWGPLAIAASKAS
eukprot:3145557-Pyramimonas_sp.AAC.1